MIDSTCIPSTTIAPNERNGLTSQIRSASTDDIACWFIDTDYNGESFFVRHAYFTGANDPYKKLKKVLRAQIDEAAWSSLYSTTSRPFDRPDAGRIAVKVINHYGGEVLKVFDVCPRRPTARREPGAQRTRSGRLARRARRRPGCLSKNNKLVVRAGKDADLLL